MKLQCSKILLLFLPLNILVTSYHAHNNNNEPHTTPHHTPIYTSRVLSESDVHSSSYDNDAEIKSVKQQFYDRTSQRFEEYEERMKEKRQKHREERDKNIQKIIDTDKREKSLAEKIEKGCLKCGCGLGGVAASVGLFGGLGVYGWKTAATNAAIAEATAKGAEEGVKVLIHKLNEELALEKLFGHSLEQFITTENYLNETIIIGHMEKEYQICFATESTWENIVRYYSYKSMSVTERIRTALPEAKISVGDAVKRASEETLRVTKSQMASLEAGELKTIADTSYYSYSAIGYSVLAILIIVLVMIIIYLVLRYRRKKKMNKKAQYTKLLNE
ncbi:rifin PIR protein, putative [Plasmodium reichenowi]|uniref:Rifin PIR protein, putative n=1 Tax=Plasmodium reichenowi TaxID=5854 RepID=A0A2P9DHB6_PLARE|nr:rifin PIR protein, putative [Plasmodium reichenowi]